MKELGIMTKKRIFTAQAITQNTAVDSLAVSLQGVSMSGIFSIYAVLVGAGSVTFTYKLSFDGITFLTPSGATTIKTGMTAGSDIFSVSPILGQFIKITATEINVGAITALTVDLMTQ